MSDSGQSCAVRRHLSPDHGDSGDCAQRIERLARTWRDGLPDRERSLS